MVESYPQIQQVELKTKIKGETNSGVEGSSIIVKSLNFTYMKVQG